MAQRRSPHRSPVTLVHAHSTRSRVRNASITRKRAAGRSRQTSNSSHASYASSDSQSDASRAVLVPLHTNLRRLPSRLFAAGKEVMRDASRSLGVTAGSKRKRVGSGIENSNSDDRQYRDGSRRKRLRSSSSRMDTSDDDGHSEMELDGREFGVLRSESGDEDEVESTDDYLINEAEPRHLRRLRKDELVRLYNAAGLSGDPETLTKPEIVEAIVAARDDVAELPPTSPPLAAADNSSECSSDDGNFGGGEETDISAKYGAQVNGLRRRVTVHDLGQQMSKSAKGRSLSLGQLDCSEARKATRLVNGKKGTLDIGYGSLGRRRANHVVTVSPSPTTSATSNGLPSPPITRFRTRQGSAENHLSASSSKNTKGKGKAKHVDFSEEVRVNASHPASHDPGEESELTDLAELEVSVAANPSPRRLRSKDKQGSGDAKSKSDSKSGRKSQTKGSRKSQSEEVGEEADGSGTEEHDEDEVDELISSASPTPPPPPPPRRTPVKRRLRPRRVQTHTPPTDSDDAHEGDDEEEEELEMDAEQMVEEESVDGAEEEDAEAVVAEPRKLRSGKVVGEGDAAEEDIEETDEEEDEDYVDAEMQEPDVDAEGETEESEESDEPMEDVDLTVATAKALVRLRRDDLVKMCESRDISPVGTKPQLAEALLQWRDRQSEFSSPSSAGTARPPSTARPRRRRTRSKTRSANDRDATPVLLRDDRVHVEQPQTPPVSGHNKKEPEPELELDLESLGLEDREIPPEKLTKLEKIGSGGFKDVYVGKFKGRRVAIAEFRGQLSAMDIKELKLLGDFNHPNIVKFLGVSIPENTRETPVMIVSELCSNGDLFDYIRNVPPPSLYRVLSMMLDIARGLEYLHTRKPSIIHRDCKSSNILITSRGVAKITDFGLAKVKQSTRSMVRSLVGTVNWQAPELWHAHPKYNHKVDVFSLAMVFWEMLQWHLPNKKFPWEGMNEHAIYEIVGAKRQRPSISGLRKQWCPEIVNLMEHMWIHEPNERPTMTEVVQGLERLQAHYR
ncbi:hypothetical protein GLOTRDRAFT_114462 [Gloeophyllum trabeum ATCC 11539]|uniref:Protein kinase domain-containing protein n=1 Tax=Gloeophyllum trabeum (strain ATCC 11539 / FP-39264 / Madison 617) TaxID=670483 RepID=S7RWY2_GLOTA|nr:uncharacterized protein GLOTRDRAFT_114462 [Gloeophyllum trabeum ATCC 11539]EPQ57864.1 hypothetical protein GLOTRDRAFT_114462 [Gloeophyllum trabeum ATCC 11539]